MTMGHAAPGASHGLTRRLAEALTNLRAPDIPAEALDAAALSLVDHLGVTLAASGLGEGGPAIAELVRAEGGAPEATLLGCGGGRVPAAAAAYANGALAHALDYEDSVDGLPVHPHAQVIPAVLALAEAHDSAGTATLAAIAVGCDLTCRIAAAAGTELSDHGWYPPPLAGALGAAAACAYLLGTNARQLTDALSLVLMQVSAPGEIKYSPHSLIRGVRDGFAAHAAVRAAQLAVAGVRGFDAPLEGRAGFFATHTAGRYDRAALLDDLGTFFHGTRVSYKPWPSCRGTHAFVEAALEVRDLAPTAEIDDVHLVGAPVNTMLAEPAETKRAPATAIDAKFSLPFTVATALATGHVGLDSFAPDALRAPDVLGLARRVRFTTDPTWDTAHRMTSGRLTVRLRDGRELHRRIDVPLGNPDRPLSTDALLAKFADCAAVAAVPPPDPARLAADLRSLAGRSGVRTLMSRHFSPTPATAAQR